MNTFLLTLAVFVSCGYCNNVSRTGEMKTTKCIGSQFWRLEVLNGGVSGAVRWLKPLREKQTLPLLASITPVASNPWHSLASRYTPLISASVVTWSPFPCVHLCLFSISYKDTSHRIKGPSRFSTTSSSFN